MKIDVLFNDRGGERRENEAEDFDAGKFDFSIVRSRWGRDRDMLRGGGHHQERAPDVVVCHSSAFAFDLVRMLRFVLTSRARAPWIIFVLLLSKDEEQQSLALPRQLKEHFSRYFILV